MKWLKYLGGMAAVMVVTFTGITYIAKNIDTVWTALTWEDDVRVVKFKSLGNALFYNNGDGDIYLLRMDFHCEELGYDAIVSIDKVIKRDEFLKYNYRMLEEGSRSIVYAGSVDEAKKLVISRKLTPQLINPNHPSLEMYRKRYGNRFVTFPAQANLVYYSSKSLTEITQPVPSVVYLLQILSKEKWKAGGL